MTCSGNSGDCEPSDCGSVALAPSDRARCFERSMQSQSFTTLPPRLRPRPGRRRHRFPVTTLLHSLLITSFLLSILATPTLALRKARFEVRRPTLVARENDILFDPRPTPQPQLYRRQFDLELSTSSPRASTTPRTESEEKEEEDEEKEKPTSTAPAAAGSTELSEQPSSTGIESAPISSDSALPKAFDGGLGTNYTQSSCPDFLKRMSNDATFISCLPFSVLLQNSVSFFATSRSSSTLDPILSASCEINVPVCSSLMSSYAQTLRSDPGCSEDYDRQNPIVRQAYNGLLAYDILHSASCLQAQSAPQTNQSSEYCYPNAATNTTSPTDSYVYYLPLGIDLPAGSMPTCSPCLRETMGIFAGAASNRTQPISLTYVDAAEMINLHCGPNYVNQSVPGASRGENAAATLSSPRRLVWIAASVTVFIGIMHIPGRVMIEG